MIQRWRRRRGDERRDPHVIGLEAAVGMEVGDAVADLREDERAGRRCKQCGADGRIDMIDVTIGLAQLTCLGCGRTWESDPATTLRA